VTGAYPVLPLGSLRPTGPARSTRNPWARTFRGTPASVREARSFVGELLAGCPARETLMTCVSEFCANAIAHTASGHGGVFTVEVDRPRDGVARVAVTDGGGASVPVPGALDLMAEGGRGLAMVAACTSRWGYTDANPGTPSNPGTPAGPGRTVWAESCWPVGVPSPRRATRQPARFRRFRAPIRPRHRRDPGSAGDPGGGAA
jgi:anti-sigma regulatory factor (Ser/Thr protein kinase)